MKAKKIREGIYWVGAIDNDLGILHEYKAEKGTTYNAYLIIDEKITLIDAVKPNFAEEMIKRISSVIDPSKIDVVVSNHVEMDHSGAIPDIMKYIPDAEIITSPSGKKGLIDHYKKNWNFKVVKTGETYNIGKRNLNFILTPMVHWPDNMVTYVPEEKILFSNDSFGQHYASPSLYDDECPEEVVLEEAQKYYANIVLPYHKQVQKEMKAVEKLDIEMLATSHGAIIRKNIDKIMEKYRQWSSNETEKKAIIVFDTMWGSTEKMAYTIKSAFEEKGYNTFIFNLQEDHISDIMTQFIDSEYVCIGSPILNNNMMPSVAGFLTYMSGLTPGKRKAFTFGSFGWGAQLKKVNKYLDEVKFEILDTIEHKYVPTEEDLEKMKASVMEKI